MRRRRRQARELRRERGQAIGVESVERRGRDVGAAGASLAARVRIRRRRTPPPAASVSEVAGPRYNVPLTQVQSATAHPAGLAAASASNRDAVLPLARSSPVSTTTALTPRGKYQKRGNGLRTLFIWENEIREHALLLVGLRHGRGVEIHPVRCTARARK